MHLFSSPQSHVHSWLLGKTLPFSVTVPTAGGVVVEVKEGVVVGVSSSEWAEHVGQEPVKNFISNFSQKFSIIRYEN